MRADVHVAALKAAAKVAFSVAFLNGCSGALDPTPNTTSSEDPSEPTATNEADVSKKHGPLHSLGKKHKDAGSPVTPTKPTTPASCDATLAATFPGTDEYRWKPEPQSAEVVACCVDELTNNETTSKYRWDCCVAYDPQADPDGKMLGQTNAFAMACTPWGPPVPPSMKRFRRSNPEIAAWIMKAVA